MLPNRCKIASTKTQRAVKSAKQNKRTERIAPNVIIACTHSLPALLAPPPPPTPPPPPPDNGSVFNKTVAKEVSQEVCVCACVCVCVCVCVRACVLRTRCFPLVAGGGGAGGGGGQCLCRLHGPWAPDTQAPWCSTTCILCPRVFNSHAITKQ